MGSFHGTDVAEDHGIRRSSRWPGVEKHFLASNPRCAACSDAQHLARQQQDTLLPSRGLQVHHAIMPFHYCILLGRPDLELDPRNLLVLCENEAGIMTEDHHFLLGHSRNFKSYMPDAGGACKRYRGLTKMQLLQDASFLVLCSKLPATWDKLVDSEKKGLREMLDTVLPRRNDARD